jgi:UDP-N-acetylmuramate dehydrogenase
MLTMQQNIPLKDYTTIHLGGSARYLTTAQTQEELFSYISQAENADLPILVLGDGSNLVVGDKGFPGVVILNRIPGFDIVYEDTSSTHIKIGAGESWDITSKRTAEMNLSGIEALSGIPGRVGSAPIQNIGAYGQEIANTLVELEAYDTLSKKIVTLSNADCDFSYRQSIFNTVAKHRYVILSITLELTKQYLEPPFYKNLETYLAEHNITEYTPQTIRQAVLELRATKLPDPAVIPNVGSFFKNPIIEKWQADDLRRTDAQAPVFDMGEGLYKASAGWLIETSELRGYQVGGIKVYDKNALVLINTGGASYADIVAVREHIIDTVRDTYRINLEQEPEEVGA